VCVLAFIGTSWAIWATGRCRMHTGVQLSTRGNLLRCLYACTQQMSEALSILVQVSGASPAAEAGIQVGDSLIRLGSVSLGSFPGSASSALLQQVAQVGLTILALLFVKDGLVLRMFCTDALLDITAITSALAFTQWEHEKNKVGGWIGIVDWVH